MASSTKIPMEKIRANNEIRFKVNPHAHEANSVMAKVINMAAPTIIPSRQLMLSNTKMMTAKVANNSLAMSLSLLSLAVSP